MLAHDSFGRGWVLIRSAAVLVLGASLWAQAPDTSPSDPAYPFLERGYRALKAHELEDAVEAFRQAAQAAPGRVQIRKELAYTYIKMGKPEKAVREFETIRRLAPGDLENALSLAFLYSETRREDRALDLLELAAQSPNPDTRRTATETLAGMRRDLETQIRRWERAVKLEPGNASARLELAAFYRKNRQYRRAIGQYQAFRRILPDDLPSLLELARLHESLNEPAEARAFYVMAWRSPEPRISELGRAGLGGGQAPPGGASEKNRNQ